MPIKSLVSNQLASADYRILKKKAAKAKIRDEKIRNGLP